jgi:hypothetical protein
MPAEYPLASAYQANQEALLIQIVYISSLKVIFADLLMQQLEVETVFWLRISQVARTIHGSSSL